MPDYDFRAPRLHVEDALGEGAVLAATPEHANYLRVDGGSVLAIQS